MPKLNPYLIENKKPIETVQEIEKYEIKKSPLSKAARVKVINKSGSNYVSEDREGYGPVWGDCDGGNYYYETGSKFSSVFLDKEPKKVYVAPPRCSSYECVYCGESRSNEAFDCCLSESCLEKHNKDVIRRWKWIGKTALSIGGSWFLGPRAAIEVGGLTWGTTKVIENATDDEGTKEVLRFIGDIGWDTAKGAFFGELIGIGSKTLASKTTQEIGHLAAKAIAVNGGKIAGDIKELIEVGRIISLCQKGYELKEKYEKYGGKAFCELARHEYHKDRGRNYDSNCEICNP